MTKPPSIRGTASFGALPRAEIWHRPVFWMFVALVIAILDAFVPAALHVYGLALAVVPVAWAMLHRRSIPVFMAVLLVIVALNGAWRVVGDWSGWSGDGVDGRTETDSVGSIPNASTPWTVFGIGRIWVLVGLQAQWWLHKQLQHRRRRRLNFRRELLDRVRERTGQVRRANKALRTEVGRRQETQHLLNQSETTFQALIQRMELQVTRKDKDGVITFANDIYCDKLGKSPSQIVGSTDEDLFSAEIAAAYRADDLRVMQTGQIVDQIEKHPTSDGTAGFAQVFKAPEYDQEGNCIGIQIIFWDVTSKHLGDMSLRDSEARKRALLDSVGDAVLLVDVEGIVVEANPAAVSLFGAGLVDQSFGSFARSVASESKPGEPQAELPAILKMTRGTRRERTIQRSDNSRFVSEVSVHDIPVGNEQGSAVVIRDVTPQRRAMEALRAAKAAAEIANRTKTEFMASVSHELRTPLGGITGLAELLEKMELSSQAHQYVGMIRDSAESLSDVIEDILDFAAIEAGRVEIDPVPIDLHRVIGDAFKSLAVRALDRPVRLIHSIAPDVPRFVVGDSKRLRQVLVNLIGNAIKFTPHGEVRVRLELETGSDSSPLIDSVGICMKVADTGVGIPFDKQKKVFGAFERGEVGTRRSFGGTGLGLSICDGLVRRMNGRIELSSQPGFGSQFVCIIPFQIVSDDVAAQHALTNPVAPRGLDSKSFKGVVHTGCKNMDDAIAESLERIGIPWTTLDGVGSRDDGRALVWFVREDSGNGDRETERAKIDWQTLHEPKQDRVVWVQVVGQAHAPRASSRDLHVNEPLTPDEVAEVISRIETDHHVYDSGNLSPAELSMLGAMDSAQRESTSAISVHDDQARLLLVDDSEVNRLVITKQLLRLGHRVETAEDGEQALRMAVDQKYDAVLMDLQMPKMDGAEATVHLREAYRRKGTAPPPVIALTAHVTLEHQQLCQNAGMVGFVTKPIRTDDLDAALRGVLNGKGGRETVSGATGDGEAIGAAIGEDGAEPGSRSDEAQIRTRLLEYSNKDRVIALSLCDAFVQEVPALLNQLRRGIETQGFAEIGRASHTLKSCLRYVAEADAVAMAAEIESMAKKGQLPSELQFKSLDDMALGIVETVKRTKSSWPAEA